MVMMKFSCLCNGRLHHVNTDFNRATGTVAIRCLLHVDNEVETPGFMLSLGSFTTGVLDRSLRWWDIKNQGWNHRMYSLEADFHKDTWEQAFGCDNNAEEFIDVVPVKIEGNVAFSPMMEPDDLIKEFELMDV